MSEYIPTIGLEIHAELRTKTKMFCDSLNDPYGSEPNVNICPVCLAHPGTLPVINAEAVKHVMRVGVALGGTLADYTEFDRKNYFYPDLPKGYQLSQYEYPLVAGGELNGVAITRVHLEEDTASSIHDEKTNATLIDYNRAGVPLMELVTEPVIASAKQAGDFARELQLLLRTLQVSEANMEKGEMRVEANISVSKGKDLGTKVEIKNLNSFRAMERAVEYEIKRQTQLLERGGKVIQQTLGWDEGKQATFPQRTKEGSADYRYFPDPDLPSLKLSEIPEYQGPALVSGMPELPSERRKRYASLGIKAEDANAYVQEEPLGAFFEAVIKGYGGDKNKIVLASNYIANDLVSLMSFSAKATKDKPSFAEATKGRPSFAKATKGRRDTEERDSGKQPEIPISAQNFRKIIDMLAERRISSRAAKDILAESVKSGTDPELIAKDANLYQVSAGADFEAVVDEVLAKNASVIADFKAGKAAALEYLLGQAMKALRGAGDPTVLRKVIRSKISSDA